MERMTPAEYTEYLDRLYEVEIKRAIDLAKEEDPEDTTMETYTNLLIKGVEVIKALQEYQSPSISTAILKNLVLQYPMIPLTGEDDEWMPHPLARPEVGDGLLVNKRCPYVVKVIETGECLDTNVVLFADPETGALLREFTPAQRKINTKLIPSFPYLPSPPITIAANDPIIDKVAAELAAEENEEAMANDPCINCDDECNDEDCDVCSQCCKECSEDIDDSEEDN